MELKELAGNRDLYDVMKKQKRKQKKIDANASKSYQKKKKVNVFEFINKKLGEKHGMNVSKSTYRCIKKHDIRTLNPVTVSFLSVLSCREINRFFCALVYQAKTLKYTVLKRSNATIVH